MSEIKAINNIESKTVYKNSSVKKAEIKTDFSDYLGQAKSLDDIFSQASKKHNVPVELLKAVGKAESNYNSNAVSKAGAQGIMQLMPETAKELGVDNSFDAEQNIMGGAKYLSALLRKYDGDTRLTLAAYNAGSGNVAKYGGIPPFDETRNYVVKVMNYMDEQPANTSAADTLSQTSAAGRFIPTAVTAPVQKNLAFLLTKDAGSTQNSLGDMEVLYSYEDYLKFIELMLRDEKDDSQENERSQGSGK